MSQYLIVSDFSRGLDTRRTTLTTKAGALITCTNAHVTRGGELEKRKAFVNISTLPANTFGLHSANDNLYVFGSDPQPPTLSPEFQYQQLVHPAGANMTKILYTENFTGQVYAIAAFDDGSIYHYFNGSRVTTWDALAAVTAGYASLASSFAALVNGEANFTATSLHSSFTITGPVNTPFVLTTSTVNNGSVNDQTFTFVTTQFPTSTLPQVSTLTFGGTFEAADAFSMTISCVSLNYTKTFKLTGTASAMGTTVKNFGAKMYSTQQSLLQFSQINTPTQWGNNSVTYPGEGFIDMSNQDSNSQIIYAVAAYQGQLAIFSRRNIQVWTMAADPSTNSKTQILNNIGTNAPRSVVSFGDIDVFFLSDSGIRSMRARDASNAATVSDIGTNIDTLVYNDTSTLAPSVRSSACAVIEPIDGRYWLAIGGKIYVYSYFSQIPSIYAYTQSASQSGSIMAWSEYVPGFNPTFMCYAAGLVYLRDDQNNVYVYGGLNGQTYDSCQVTVTLPFLDADKPATTKTWTGFDAALDGTWDIYVNSNPLSPNAWDLVTAGQTGSTYPTPFTLTAAQSTHIGVQMISAYPGYARIGNIAIHFNIDNSL